MMKDTKKLILETQQSYYDYIGQVAAGCKTIAKLLKAGEIHSAMQSIANLSEGLVWLSNVEKTMKDHSYAIDSHVQKATNLYREILEAIEINDYQEVASKFDNEMYVLFMDAEKLRFEENIS